MTNEEELETVTFQVEIRSYQGGDPRVQRSIMGFLWTHLTRAFGADRCRVSMVLPDGTLERVPYSPQGLYDLRT